MAQDYAGILANGAASLPQLWPRACAYQVEGRCQKAVPQLQLQIHAQR